MDRNRRIAVVYGVLVGEGGLAVQTANAIAALAHPRADLHALGPGLRAWPRSKAVPPVQWHELPSAAPAWAAWRPLRSWRGLSQWTHDTRVGASAAERFYAIGPAIVYAFTHVGLESLR